MSRLPASRWRTGPASGGRGATDRVRLSHAQARTTLRLALAFVAGAAVAAVLADSRWLPLHLFLAGGVVLAISGVSLMLTVTWSAAPAPANRWVAGQRVGIAAGAAGIGFGRQAGWGDAALAVSGALYGAGLVLLGALLVTTVRRGVERRFDVAVTAYVAALAAGAAGVGIGVRMVVAPPSPGLRDAHVAVNLLGFVGLVLAGTMPFFAATVGRTRMALGATPVRLALLVCWQIAAVVVAACALAATAESLAAAGLGAYAAGIVAVLASLPRPTRRQLRWAGPRLVGLWLGGVWWTASVAATAADAAAGRAAFGGRWLVVLVIAAYAQILWGSLAYLLPMLRGGGRERLTEGFATTRSWLGLAAANVAGLSAALSISPTVTTGAVAVWVLDGAWRAARVGTTRAPRPSAG